MSSATPFPIRKECPPGACTCGRDELLEDPTADLRILRLTRDEEKRLIERIEVIASHEELMRICQRMHEQIGLVLSIAPGAEEVRTVRGLAITVEDRPGLCRKLRQSIPAAVRRCLEARPEIVYAILDAHDLFGMG
ncbi:hypothetical protein [Noviherbaspirillum pedocola]|uniref:Ribosomal protein S3AE n=1 Tax=Noviherbaspirillum pedocola TaxID=2801341 RepID=A0A934SWE1_9BURK|nr:hypothetical protein [Noviherbaspirillum pedocola]MBK4736638.1 hypothetical protein [Noviherbaspirillum pedocola]